MEKTITINEAIARMLNIAELPLNCDITDYLDALALEAETNLENIKDNQKSTEIAQLIVDAAIHRFQLAHCFKNHIMAELENPSGSSLLKKSEQTSPILHIEYQSFLEWADQHYCMGRLDYEELNDSLMEKTSKRSEREAMKIAKEGMTGKVAMRVYILFAHLLELFIDAKKNKKGFGTADAINVAQTADSLHESIQIHRNDDRFYDIETIKTRIEVAIAMKKLYGKK